VEPQRNKADIIVPRGIENTVAISIVSDRIKKTLSEKSEAHQLRLQQLDQVAEDYPLTENAIVMAPKSQIVGINTLLMNPLTSREDFIFYVDRIACVLIEQYVMGVSIKS
jgi:uridine kinase